MSTEIMDGTAGQEAKETKDTMYLLGGAALMLFGAGLILSNSTVRRYLGGVGIGNLLHAAAPDIERYMKLRSM
jgi:hypothetical protein